MSERVNGECERFSNQEDSDVDPLPGGEFINPVRDTKHFNRTEPSEVRDVLVQNPKALEASNAASISIMEPREISKKRFRSAGDFLEQPSPRFR